MRAAFGVLRARPESGATITHPAHNGPEHRPPSRLAIARAVPAGSRRARDQRTWLRAVLAAIESQGWYACRARHTADVARVLALGMDWRARTSRPGHERIAAAARISLRTVRRAVRWLEAEGFAGLVSPGTTPEFSPGVLHAQDEGNLAAVYVLAVPRKPRRPLASSGEFGRLTVSSQETCSDPRTREARAGKTKPERAPRALTSVPAPADRFPSWQHPKTRSEEIGAAGVVRGHARLLRQLSARHWRHLARRYTAAGWTASDVLHALDHRPGGREHWHTAEVRDVAAWARYRLGFWLDGQNQPLPSPSQRRAAERDQARAEQSARRAERLSAAERPVDVAAHAARAREMLRGRRVAGGPAAPRRDGSAPSAPGQERLRRPADRAEPGSGPATAAARIRQLSGQRAGVAVDLGTPGPRKL